AREPLVAEVARGRRAEPVAEVLHALLVRPEGLVQVAGAVPHRAAGIVVALDAVQELPGLALGATELPRVLPQHAVEPFDEGALLGPMADVEQVHGPQHRSSPTRAWVNRGWRGRAAGRAG